MQLTSILAPLLLVASVVNAQSEVGADGLTTSTTTITSTSTTTMTITVAQTSANSTTSTASSGFMPSKTTNTPAAVVPQPGSGPTDAIPNAATASREIGLAVFVGAMGAVMALAL